CDAGRTADDGLLESEAFMTRGILVVVALATWLAASPAHVAEAQRKSESTRTEHDLLGEKAVPANAYYGVQTARALENFQISGIPMSFYPEFIEGFAIVKVAAARANTQLGAMKRERLEA